MIGWPEAYLKTIDQKALIKRQKGRHSGGLFVVFVRGSYWPTPVHRIAEKHAWRIAAYWSGPVRQSWGVPITVVGRACVKTQNSKSQVGIALHIPWFQGLMWGFYTHISN